ncbi:phosphatase PAP2 family protein [Shewanella sp.]|uniref:phosphatase PAP2 family protein n=1 Tax=Shewanella sp. TaxID=50422 RepID=UPI003A97C9C3
MAKPFTLAQRWCTNKLVFPFLFGVLAITIINIFHIDIVLAKSLFSLEGGVQWHLRHQVLFERVLHNGGRQLVTLMATALLIAAVISQWVPKWRHYRRSILMTMLSILSTILLVRYGKAITNVSCPWDLVMFGGDKPLVMFPDTLFSQQTLGQCYPGGHSSGAFAWVVMYYFALVNKPAWRKPLLSLAIGLGAVFAMTQELRGAHFFSHDLTSLWLAWLIATSWYGVLYRPWQQPTTQLNDASPDLKLMPVEPQA